MAETDVESLPLDPSVPLRPFSKALRSPQMEDESSAITVAPVNSAQRRRSVKAPDFAQGRKVWGTRKDTKLTAGSCLMKLD